jgi:hypothetical protein
VSPGVAVEKERDMTSQKSFKRRVRARMQKTGESYTAARRQLLAKAGEDGTPVTVPGFEPPMSDEAVERGTGRSWEAWFRVLDQSGAAEKDHKEIAAWLVAQEGVSGWWAQGVTVAYEQARGRRLPGERPDGFSITASKTIGVPVERLFEAFVDPGRRERWLPGGGLRERTSTAPKSARFDWEDGSTRVIVGFIARDDAKSQVALEHERLPDADSAEAMKEFWRERVAALKEVLEA